MDLHCWFVPIKKWTMVSKSILKPKMSSHVYHPPPSFINISNLNLTCFPKIVFSASYYCGTNVNQGGYAVFFSDNDKLDFLLKSYYAQKGERPAFDPLEMQRQTSQKIKDKIYQKKADLLYSFSLMDPDQTEEISVDEWANGLTSVLKLNLPWTNLQPYFAKADPDTGNIRYKDFLNRYQLKSAP